MKSPSYLPRDLQDLMAYPFFSLSKNKRIEPIEYQSGNVFLRVEAVNQYGLATIWDADILIWAITQIVTAKNKGLIAQKRYHASGYEILKFIERDIGQSGYKRLKASLNRLQSTTISTSIRQKNNRYAHRFSWINEWHEKTDHRGKPIGLEIIFPDWLFNGANDETLVLTLHPGYFSIRSGYERWLYRLIRKHVGKNGWAFEFRHLYPKSASLAPFKKFVFELRRIIANQPFPEYQLSERANRIGEPVLSFAHACGKAENGIGLSGTRTIGLSGTLLSGYREPKHHLNSCKQKEIRSLNYLTNRESNLLFKKPFVDKHKPKAIKPPQDPVKKKVLKGHALVRLNRRTKS
ncbi:replication initiator protein A [Bartonella sp. LJL80]